MSGRKATQGWRLDRLARWSAVATRRRLVLAPAFWPAVRIRLSPVCPALPLQLAVGRLSAVRLNEALESSGGRLAVLLDGRPYLLNARPLLPDESGC